MEVEEGRVDAVADPENPKVPLFRASLPFKSPNSMNALPLTSPSLPQKVTCDPRIQILDFLLQMQRMSHIEVH